MKMEKKGQKERRKNEGVKKKVRQEGRQKNTWNKHDVVFRLQNSIANDQELILLPCVTITKAVFS